MSFQKKSANNSKSYSPSYKVKNIQHSLVIGGAHYNGNIIVDESATIPASWLKPYIKPFFVPYLELSYNNYFFLESNGAGRFFDTKTAKLADIMPMFGGGAGIFMGDHFGLSLNGYGAPFFSGGTGSFGIIDLSSEYIIGKEVLGKYGDKHKLRLVTGWVYYDGSIIVLDGPPKSFTATQLLNNNSITVTESHGVASNAQGSGISNETYVSGHNTTGPQGPVHIFGYNTGSIDNSFQAMLDNFTNNYQGNTDAIHPTGPTVFTSGHMYIYTSDFTFVSKIIGAPIPAIGTSVSSDNIFSGNIKYSNSNELHIGYFQCYNYGSGCANNGGYEVVQTWTPEISNRTVTRFFGPQYQQYLNQTYTITYDHTDASGTTTQVQTTAMQTFSPSSFSIMTGADYDGDILGLGSRITSTPLLTANGDFANNTNTNFQVGSGNASGAISAAQNVLLFAATNHWTSNEFTSAFGRSSSGIFGIKTDVDWNASWHTGTADRYIAPTYYNGGHLVSDILSNNGNTHNLTYEHEAQVNYQGNAYLIGVNETYSVTSNYNTIISNYQGQIAQYDAAHQALLDQMGMLARSQYKIRTGGIKFGAGHTYIINKYCGMKFDINDTIFLSHESVMNMIGLSTGLQIYF